MTGCKPLTGDKARAGTFRPLLCWEWRQRTAGGLRRARRGEGGLQYSAWRLARQTGQDDAQRHPGQWAWGAETGRERVAARVLHVGTV